MCLSVCVSVSVCLSVCLCIYRSMNVSIHLSVFPYVYTSIHLSVYRSIQLQICQPTYLPTFQCIHLCAVVCKCIDLRVPASVPIEIPPSTCLFPHQTIVPSPTHQTGTKARTACCCPPLGILASSSASRLRMRSTLLWTPRRAAWRQTRCSRGLRRCLVTSCCSRHLVYSL